ncbi:hypothetical protein [Shewanella oncorhynchi]|uniref:hypothetical protein n=1 Tax=Shewanella oncorhynchi TaxID=2726434 RepID=UPI002E7ABF20|nr:hypothetical protein [Shewanella oncorhynchi]WVI91419.1 hypothetical protein VR487_11195 [Shewanella oncorhynchi]
MEKKMEDKQEVSAIKHTRSSDFQTKLASGVVANLFGDRVELSFYNDTAVYLSEELTPVPGSMTDFTSTGEIMTAMIREHSVGVSMNLEQLKGLKALLEKIIVETGAGERS